MTCTSFEYTSQTQNSGRCDVFETENRCFRPGFGIATNAVVVCFAALHTPYCWAVENWELRLFFDHTRIVAQGFAWHKQLRYRTTTNQ